MKSKSKKMTLEDLAKVVQTGFSKTANDIRKLATKGELNEGMDNLARMVKESFDETPTKDEITELRQGLSNLTVKVDTGFNRVEGMLANHSRRLDKADDNIRVIKTKINLR